MAEVLTAAGWSVVILEKGRNHLIDLEPPHDPLRHFANDEIALGFMSGMASRGRRAPHDYSIVGIDDIEMASVRQPGLTSVKQAIDRCGSLGVEMLLQAIGGDAVRSSASLEAQLIVRGSTAPPR